MNAVARVAHYDRKVAATTQAQRGCVIDRGIDAGHLMFMIIGFAACWFSVPQLATMLTGADVDTTCQLGGDARRGITVRLVGNEAHRSSEELFDPSRHGRVGTGGLGGTDPELILVTGRSMQPAGCA